MRQLPAQTATTSQPQHRAVTHGPWTEVASLSCKGAVMSSQPEEPVQQYQYSSNHCSGYHPVYLCCLML